MKQVQLVGKISDLFLQFSKEVKDRGKLKLADINIVSEDILVPILSIIYDTDLRNLNLETGNFPGIDLATDEQITYLGTKKRIAFQITSTSSIDKIKHTLNQYVAKKSYEKFDELYIFNLVQKQGDYTKKSIEDVNNIVDKKFKFDLTKNVIDKIDLIKVIKTLTPISKIESIYKLLEDQFVYNKKSLLSLEIWESDGKLGYGFSNLLNSIDSTTYNTLIKNTLSNDAQELLNILFLTYNNSFALNFEQEKADKFKNLGFNTYLKAGFTQALNSFIFIKNKIKTRIDKETFSKELSDSFQSLELNLKESDFPLVNQPINHPAIQFIKTTALNIFRVSRIDETLIESFIKYFNENIQNCISETFGQEDYKIHLEETKEKWIRDNEKDLLLFQKNLSKLGFSDGEELQYQETYGTWKDIREYGISDEGSDKAGFMRNARSIDEIVKYESKLKPVEELIGEYFEYYKGDKEGFLNNILFLIADFGKGKTSFLHYFASKLSEKYIMSHEGFFPVYLNLNEYDKYGNSPSLGVIANYLAKNHKINIKDDYFKKKDFFFLIDSLDECGELTEINIDRAVKDIIEIQNLDNINQRNNRIIIASRPIAKGLKEQITKYKPFIIEKAEKGTSIEARAKEDNSNEITENFISVYGFKIEQFDGYLDYAFKKYLVSNPKGEFTGYSKDIFSKIEKKDKVNIYEDLFNKVLKETELRRPIFAYMIYKLVISNSNFFDFGKVGVYISFLNQLSREAKHKDDSKYKVRLIDEFIYRNILHASALLWQFRRQSGEQTSLSVADICRTIEEDEIDKSDSKVLSEFNEINAIKFLSHSYLGEKENTLHFQHQSFAEILLAEYYLKVFIKYSFEENLDIEDARVKLSIGMPTDQTVDFLKGLLLLLKDCTLGDVNDPNTISKRELFIPLLASLAINKHNKKLYCDRLHTKWFERYEAEVSSGNRINIDMVIDFPITKLIFDKLEILCVNILNSSKSYIIDEPSEKTILFKRELARLDSLNGKLFEIDKWFALIVGNSIGTDVNDNKFFNAKLAAKNIFELIRKWNFSIGPPPTWGRDQFMGIFMRENEIPIELEYFNLIGLNFSYSYLKMLVIDNSNLSQCDFSNSTFENFNIINSDIRKTQFNNIKIINNRTDSELLIGIKEGIHFEGDFCLTFCFIIQGVLFPKKLNACLKGEDHGLIDFNSSVCEIENLDFPRFCEDFKSLKGVFKYILQTGKKSDYIISAFKFRLTNKPHTDFSKWFKEFIMDIENEVNADKSIVTSASARLIQP